jgi:hypothetical protein
MASFGHGARYATAAAAVADAAAAHAVGANAKATLLSSGGCLAPGQLLAAGAAAERRAAAGVPLQGSFAANAATKAPGDADNDAVAGRGAEGGDSLGGPSRDGLAGAAARREAEAYGALPSAARRAAALDALPVSAFGTNERLGGPGGPVHSRSLSLSAHVARKKNDLKDTASLPHQHRLRGWCLFFLSLSLL